MKNIKKFYIISILLLVLVIGSEYIVQASLNKKNIDIQVIEKLLNKRIHIMNNGLFGGKDLSLVISELKDIERGKLLDWDLQMIKEIKESPTDLPYVNSSIIKEIKEIEVVENKLILTLLIEWDISYYEERKKEEFLYSLEIIEEDGKLYLSDLNCIQ